MRQSCSPFVFLGSMIVALAAALMGAAPPADALPTTRAERSNFTETSTLADVQAFLAALSAQADLIRVSTFGSTEQGRPLLLATLSNPPVGDVRDVRALGRPVVLLQANIHGGEVEGKEAVQNLMRRLTLGDLRPLLDRVVVLVVPVYNADGNEAIDAQNRTAQYGPIAGVGARENANGLDLNRDFMKLDSAEARALVRLLNTWDPHVVVDLHTTNGSHHGFHLTYSIPLNLSLDAALLAFERDTLMPALQESMLKKHDFRTYYYGNFTGRAPKPGEEEQRKWVAFDHRPRIGQNYVGLRNRIAILSEAYSYLDFKSRIAVTEAFSEEILRYCAEHAPQVMALTAAIDAGFVQRARGQDELPLGVEYEQRALPGMAPLLVGQVTHQVNPRNGKEMTVMLPDKFTLVPMPDFGYFAPTRSVPMARAYALPRTDAMRPIVQKLRQHGILVEELTAPVDAQVATFTVTGADKAKQPFQGHQEVHVTGSAAVAPATLPAGTVIVRLAQPLGRLAAYLLEPESDDGLGTWNYFDAAIEQGRAHPVGKIMEAAPLPVRALQDF